MKTEDRIKKAIVTDLQTLDHVKNMFKDTEITESQLKQMQVAEIKLNASIASLNWVLEN